MLDGDFEHDPQRQNKREPKPKAGKPPCPRWIKGTARTEWNRICKLLMETKVLTKDCGPALEQYVLHYHRWRLSAKAIMSGEATRTDQIAFREASQFCHRWLCEFGLTPASRTRVQIEVETNSRTGLADKYLA
jgi:P27 family predicted phage terminase small subunit